jgi:hypothetical protein
MWREAAADSNTCQQHKLPAQRSPSRAPFTHVFRDAAKITFSKTKCLRYGKAQVLCIQKYHVSNSKNEILNNFSVTLLLPDSEETKCVFISYITNLFLIKWELKELLRFQVLTAKRMRIAYLSCSTVY